MRIVFIGASAFGLRCLKAMESIAGCKIVGAVTAPPVFAGGRLKGAANATHADVAGWAEARGVPCATVTQGMKDEGLIAGVRGWAPDCFIVAGWHSLIPTSWFDIAPAYGLHASLLPDYSGGAPLVWALIHGEERTGISLFQLAAGVDDGPLLGQREEEIRPDDTIGTLYARIEDRAIELLRDVLPRLAAGTAEFTIQDESRRRIFPLRKPDDGLIDWNHRPEAIRNFVRAQTRPYPGAFTMRGEDKLTLWAVRAAADAPEVAPGALRKEGGRLFAGCAGGAVEILELAVNGVETAPGSVA